MCSRALRKRRTSENSVEAKFVELPSLLKKWLSTWSAVHDSSKTRQKHYEGVIFGP
jgi:hypothetical protein